MKYYLLSTIFLLPCIMMFSDGETLLPNIIGIVYTITLYRLSFTKLGKKIFKETYKFNYKLLKQF